MITSLDMTLPDPAGAAGRVNWRTLLERTLPFVDIFVPSIEEILYMLRRTDYDKWQADPMQHISLAYLCDLADELFDMGSSAVVGFKLGAFGIYLQTGTADCSRRLERLPINYGEWVNKRIWHPAFEVEVAGTTGAGDLAYAGLLVAMLKGYTLEDCARWACAVGACNVEAADATSGVQSWDAIQERLDQGWKTISITLT